MARMRVLIVGGGGREHALAYTLAKSPSIRELHCTPGNPGIARLARCHPGIPLDQRLADWAVEQGIDLVFIGPEQPLAEGIVDHLESRGIAAVGPTQAAARLESSKIFAKELMKRRGIPTGSFAAFDHLADALAYVQRQEGPLVIKADGLAAGKGVWVCANREEAEAAVRWCLEEEGMGPAGRRIVIEQFLEGEEASLLVLTDGTTLVPLATAQDHKTLGEGDTGPNTGGMGAYSPAPVLPPDLVDDVLERIVRPVIEAMAADGHPYRGVLYAGLMLTDDGPKVLEFNCRLGDPETQVVLPRLEGDLAVIGQALVAGRLHEVDVHWKPDHAACVVVASGGYPGSYEKGHVITGIDEAEREAGVIVFHAGTAEREGRFLTAGGRVLGVTGMGPDLRIALERAYRGVARITFPGMQFRRDIGHRALARLA